MFVPSLIHQIVFWIVVPIVSVIGFVAFQLHGLHDRFTASQEQHIVNEVGRVERELQFVLTTTEQLAAMTARDGKTLLACTNREVDTLFRIGSNMIASRLIDQVTFIDTNGIVLARGHDEFAFNDSLTDDPLFLLASRGERFTGIVRFQERVAFVAVQPVLEYGAVFRGALILCRWVTPQFIERMGQELGLSVVIDHSTGCSAHPADRTPGIACSSKTLPFPSIDPAPWLLTISRSHAAALEVFNAARSKIFLFTLLATIATLCFVYISVRYLLRPLRRLHTWLQQHKAGTIGMDALNRNILAHNNTSNELGFIAHAALTTIQDLETARTELEGLHQGLERLVEERTRQLSSKTEQLQNEVREREQAELTIRGLKNHLQNIVDSMQCVLIGVDANGRITFVNSQTEQRSGLTNDALQGTDVRQLLSMFGLEAIEFPDQTPQHCGQWHQRRITIPYGGMMTHFDVTTYPFCYEGQRGQVLRIDDVTRQVVLEQELFTVEKLQSIGLLAGGIAHDFNNYLAAILGNINLAHMGDQLHERTRELLTKAEQASLSAKELTGQLLTFAQGGEPRKKLTDLKETVRQAANLAMLGNHCPCRFDFPDDLWSAEIDPGQIEQVVRNIVVNAAQAMAEGETVDIACANIDAVNDKHLEHLPAGPYVRITVIDRGFGMPAEIVKHIFDPYFSTKSEGKGMGLAICHSIVRKHGGIIAVESSPGTGTSFFIYLPARPDATPTQVMTDQAEGDGLSALRVLVMDDDPMVREVIGSMLDLLGHQVIFAVDGAEAIKKYQAAIASDLQVDILLMDLIVPGGMGGKEAVREILRLRPDARAIVSSGYCNDPVLANCREYGFAAAIAKPYQLKELARVISEVMAQPTANTDREPADVAAGDPLP